MAVSEAKGRRSLKSVVREGGHSADEVHTIRPIMAVSTLRWSQAP